MTQIKTIGDCIQVAGGVPEQIQSEEDVKHTAEKVCILGLLMISTLQSICDKNRNTVETPMDLKLRVGINSGEVIAGVIGLWKFKYGGSTVREYISYHLTNNYEMSEYFCHFKDLWSTDTDIASIMEQSGKHNIPHISPKTYDLVKQSQRLSFSKGDIIEAFGHRLPTHDVKFVDEESAQQIQKIIKQIKESQPTSRLRQSSSAKTTPSAINSKSNVAADVSLNSFNMSGLSMLKANVSDKAIYSPADVVKNMDDVAVNNNPIKGASYINPTKQKIREILSNFKTETHKMTGKME